jgi:hypothetical protein
MRRSRAIAVVLVLAACGGGDDGGADDLVMPTDSGSADSATSAGSGGDAGGVPQCEPLPNRCEQACMDANQAALSSCDLAGWVAMLPPDVAMALMACIPACDSDASDDPMCVGMGSAADCDCQEQCYADNLDASQLAGAADFAACYEAAVASACG